MQIGSKEFPEIPGESVIERKKRQNRWKFQQIYRQRVEAGFCGRCGKHKPKTGCVACVECLKRLAEYNAQRINNQSICSRCGKTPPEEGRRSCRPCLDRLNILNRKRRNTTKEGDQC